MHISSVCGVCLRPPSQLDMLLMSQHEGVWVVSKPMWRSCSQIRRPQEGSSFQRLSLPFKTHSWHSNLKKQESWKPSVNLLSEKMWTGQEAFLLQAFFPSHPEVISIRRDLSDVIYGGTENVAQISPSSLAPIGFGSVISCMHGTTSEHDEKPRAPWAWMPMVVDKEKSQKENRMVDEGRKRLESGWHLYI